MIIKDPTSVRAANDDKLGAALILGQSSVSCYADPPCMFKLTCLCCTCIILSAAKPENVANHCPLCHDNFSPGEEVRLLTRLL